MLKWFRFDHAAPAALCRPSIFPLVQLAIFLEQFSNALRDPSFAYGKLFFWIEQLKATRYGPECTSRKNHCLNNALFGFRFKM